MHIDMSVLAVSDQYFLLAQATAGDPFAKFIEFIKPILSIVTLVMVLWSGFLIHDGKIREGIYALAGAVIVFTARLIVQGLGS